MMANLYDKKIPIILLNGRITKKTLGRWLIFPNLQIIISKISDMPLFKFRVKKTLKI